MLKSSIDSESALFSGENQAFAAFPPGSIPHGKARRSAFFRSVASHCISF
jgi:hypothetical protein